MELRKVLSIACVLLFIFYLLWTKSKRRGYILFVLYLLPLIDLYVTPANQGSFSVFDIVSYFGLIFIIKGFRFTISKNVVYLFLFMFLAFLLFVGALDSEFVNVALISFIKFFPIFIFTKALIEEVNHDPSFKEQIINALATVCLVSVVFLSIQVVIGPRFSLYSSLNINVSIESSLRYTSFFHDPQKYAQYLSLCSFFFLLRTRYPTQSKTRNHLFFLMVVISMFLTGSRAAFGGLCVGLAIVFLAGESKYRAVAIAGGLAAYILIILFGEYFPLFNRGESVDESYEFRNQIWQEAIEIFHEHIVLGIGIGNYQSYVEIYAPNQFWYVGNGEIMYFDHPESGYLKMMIEYGLYGFILLSLFVLIPIFSAVRRFFRGYADTRIFYSIGAILGWMISYLTVYSLSDKRVLIPLAIHICLLILSDNNYAKTIHESKSNSRYTEIK